MKAVAYFIEKVSDDIFDGIHPNGIDVGYIKQSPYIYPQQPKVGEKFQVGTLRTSFVMEGLNDKGEFKTLNSTYILHYVFADGSKTPVTPKNYEDGIGNS